jgi:hypothetical protein
MFKKTASPGGPRKKRNAKKRGAVPEWPRTKMKKKGAGPERPRKEGMQYKEAGSECP